MVDSFEVNGDLIVMGCDYSSIHVFAGDADPEAVRSRVIERIGKSIPGRACAEDEATRSIVVGPPDRWIFVDRLRQRHGGR